MNNSLCIKIIEYLIYFLIGGFVAIICLYLSKNKKIKLLALLPGIPIVGIYGLLLTLKHKNDVNLFLQSLSKSVGLAFIFYTSILLINKVIKKILVSLFISLTMWFFLVYKIIFS